MSAVLYHGPVECLVPAICIRARQWCRGSGSNRRWGAFETPASTVGLPRQWWEGVDSNHSPKDRSYNPAGVSERLSLPVVEPLGFEPRL
jgi:hypothetical protein